MKTSSLHDHWTAPDNSRLTSKQFSFRLPAHVAAQLAALEELYPQKNRTQIVADLLTGALSDLEKNLPEDLGEPQNLAADEMIASMMGARVGETIYTLGGVRGEFRTVANRYYRQFENELGNENADPLFADCLVTESMLKASKK